MKKSILCFFVFALIAVLCFCAMDFETIKTDNENFLRIHIRADSNDMSDQRVKHKVRDAIIVFLSPYLTYADTKPKAMQIVKGLLKEISAVATQVLKQNDFEYCAKAVVTKEVFPTKKYQDLVLESGKYDALLINLGSGEGDNWWCVVYPPLCFVGGTNTGDSKITYVSKLKEIIDKFKNSIGQ